FDVYAIHPKRLTRETSERSLLRDALFRSLKSRPGITIEKLNRKVFAIPNPSIVKPSQFHLDKVKPVSRLSGTVGKSKPVRWAEACLLQIDYRLDRLWLLLQPRIILS